MMETTNDSRSVRIQIIKTPVIPFKLSAFCDCGGEFVFSDVPVALHPRTYKHICNKCGFEVYLSQSFPQTIHEELTSESESN